MRDRLRESYACDCGPRLVPAGRLTHCDLAEDAGEYNLRLAEDATSVRPESCPWKALRDPFVAEVIRAHRWFKERQLETHYGGDVPADITWGVETFEAALQSVRSADTRLDKEERELEARVRKAKADADARRAAPRAQAKR